jgi:hypothetical protein
MGSVGKPEPIKLKIHTHVEKDDFSEIISDTADTAALFGNLIDKQYIDENGLIQDKFTEISNYSEMSLDSKFNSKKAEIYSVLKRSHTDYSSEMNGIKLVFPMLLADRLVAQSGGFTIQDPLKCIMQRGEEDFDAKTLDIFEIYEWILPEDSKSVILDELHRISVNRRTLFPGLDGLCRVLGWQERIRLWPGGRNT